MDIRIKICGMREKSNILDVARLGPDYMGFIFYRETPRYVGDDFSIPDEFPFTTKRVGVFVNQETDEILDKVMRFRLDFVQLHGTESVSQCQELKNTGVGVIKVFSVDDDMDFRVTHPYSGAVDFFLFDTKGKYFGGNSKTFNWEVLHRYDQEVPFFLSGGINAANAEGIKSLKALNLQAVDLNSGVEIRPALKDVARIVEIRSTLNAKS
jgi:phosphoribosylanthranilate isomerase